MYASDVNVRFSTASICTALKQGKTALSETLTFEDGNRFTGVRFSIIAKHAGIYNGFVMVSLMPFRHIYVATLKLAV